MIHRMDPAPADFEADARARQADAGARRASSRRTTTAGRTSSSGTACAPSSTSTAGGCARFTRNDKSLMTTFPELRDIGLFLGSRSAILDGEIVALDKDESPELLDARQPPSRHVEDRDRDVCAKSIPASFFAFDLLYLEGHSLMSRSPTTSAALRSSRSSSQGETFATPPSITERQRGRSARVARERGLEGVVIKRRSSRYAPGRATATGSR